MTKARGKTGKANRALDLLHTEVAAILTSDAWKDALKLRAKFHKYSVSNLLLILLQRPDATQVAGFRRWQELKRQVKKGEKGIAILAPLIGKDKDDPEKRVVYGFRTAYVFDYAQTEGEELPQPPRGEEIQDDSDEAKALLAALTRFAESKQFPVTFSDDLGTAKGSYNPVTKAIRVANGLSAGQAAKTLAHEIAHGLADHSITADPAAYDFGELEAETAAFLITDAVGLDASSYSFHYLAGYTQEEGNLDALLRAGARATKIADEVTAWLKDHGEIGESLKAA